MASNVRSFAVSHQEGYSLAEGSEVPENKLVADSIRVELRRLRALEDELNNSIAQEVSSKGGPMSRQTALDKPDVFAPYVSPVRSSRHGGGGGSPASNKHFTSSSLPRPAFPIGGPASSHNTYAVDLDSTGRFIPAIGGCEQPQSMNTTAKGHDSLSSKNGPPSSQQWSPAVFSSSSAVATVADPSAVYLDHYQRKYDEVIARREAAEAAKHEKEGEAEETYHGLLLDDAKRTGRSAAVGDCNKETTGGGGGGGGGGGVRDLSLLSTVGGIDANGSAIAVVDGGPHAVIKPFAAESSDVESGIGDVRSSILELKAKREQRELLAKLEEKARVGRTVTDDAVEALLRDVESAQQMKHIVSKSTNAGGLPEVYRHHLLGGVLGSKGAEGQATETRLVSADIIGGSVKTDISSSLDSNQHGLFVEFNTDRKAIAEASAASAAAYELSQIPFANSRIGREFNDRKRRVYSAHISKEHDIEVKARQHFLKNSPYCRGGRDPLRCGRRCAS